MTSSNRSSSPVNTGNSLPVSPPVNRDNSFPFSTDISYTVTDISYTMDLSDNDCSTNFILPVITDFSYNHIIDISGYEITYQSGSTLDNSNVTITLFNTTDPSFMPQITEDLVQVETTYNDETDSSNNAILHQIKIYASEIQCQDFHGKGSIDDYANLFQAASKIANESKQMQLDLILKVLMNLVKLPKI